MFLCRMAESEILREANRAAVRHSTAGISGWRPCPKPNKFFLTNMILQNAASNRIQSHKLKRKLKGDFKAQKKRPERKLLQCNSNGPNIIFKMPDKNKNNCACINSGKKTQNHNSNSSIKKVVKKNTINSNIRVNKTSGSKS